MTASLGTIGVWRQANALTPQFAATVEELGYTAIWVGGSPPADLTIVEDLLDATGSITVATGIVNIYTAEAWPVAASYRRISDKYPGRFLLGVGVGHPENVGARYQPPYEALQRYLDELEAAAVPPEDIVLAALGPRVLRLAGERTAGAHPYLTTPEHTARAREILGTGVLLAPEHKVVLDTDPRRAREIGRARVANPYLRLANYTNNLRRLGFSASDLADGGSDRLVDALVAHGDGPSVAARLQEHLGAGADHVAVQPLVATPDDDPVPGLRELAAALF
jgi:probable F420-dependent oxidoreductase